MNHLEKATNKEKLAGYNLICTREPERDVSEEAGQKLVQYFWCLSVECSVLITLCLAVCCYPCDYFTCRWIEVWEGMCKSQLCLEVSSTAMWHHKVEICQPLLLLPRGSLLVVGLTSPQSHLPCVLLWFDCYGLCYCFCLLSFVPPCSYLK